MTTELEKQLERELNRLGELIDGVADTGSVKSMRAAMTAASQLARLRERMIDRQELGETPQTTPPETSDEAKLAAVRELVQQYAAGRGGTQAT